VFGGECDGLKAGRAESVDVTADADNRHACAQARDARHIQTLLGLRHRASQDHVVYFGRLDAGRARRTSAITAAARFVRPS